MCLDLTKRKNREVPKSLVRKLDIGVLPLFHGIAMTAVMNASIIAGCYMVLFPRTSPSEEFLKNNFEIT